jgi:phosphoglucosamine mutase
MGKLFGTDGIRGNANTYPMTAEIALRTGRAIAHHFNKKSDRKVVIGKDTRLSGDIFEHALAAGLCSMGTEVLLAGVIPTPGVAYLCKSMPDVAAGIVISASHNPYQDNGIKVFNGEGFKLDMDEESGLEKTILADDNLLLSENQSNPGRISILNDSNGKYRTFLKNLMPNADFSGVKAVIDCSNGASSSVAPTLFNDMGLDVTPLFTTPDGKNINNGCGSEHLQAMIEKVKETKSDLGLAFDGDADRMIAVDKFGNTVTGDQLIAIIAKNEKENGHLDNNTVVTTVMSNMGLGACLGQLGIRHIMAQVGDRNVMLDMKKTGAVVGGEDSGHMIFLNHHSTGDGLISALKLLQIIKTTNSPLHELAEIMTVYPQKLVNVTVKEKPEIHNVQEIQNVISDVESQLTGKGRVLVRYSGTQNMCRVMVEAPTTEQTELYARQIAGAVQKVIGD